MDEEHGKKIRKCRRVAKEAKDTVDRGLELFVAHATLNGRETSLSIPASVI